MAERKKILFVVEAMGGGVFTYIVDLANELINIYDIYIAYAIRKQTPDDYKDYFDKRIHLIKVKNFERSIEPAKDIKAYFEIKKIEKEIQPNIIHLHSSKAGALGRWAFNGNKVPLFYTPHGYSFLMQNHSPAKRMIYKAVESISGKRTCTTISCSNGEHQETLKLTRNATYVDNGININELQKMMGSVGAVKEHPFTVFTLGRICPQKNPGLFNKVALALPGVRFVWIGDGELRHELTAPNIEITGWVERKLAFRHSMNGDVFLLTSLWEGLPISLLEAMYMKKLCVVNDVIGNKDVIHNENNGYVCHGIDEFVQVLRSVQGKNVSELVGRAYGDILTRYNTGIMAKKYSEIYMSMFPSNIKNGITEGDDTLMGGGGVIVLAIRFEFATNSGSHEEAVAA